MNDDGSSSTKILSPSLKEIETNFLHQLTFFSSFFTSTTKQQLHQELKSIYSKIILSDPVNSFNNNVDLSLFKICFYRLIDLYRRRSTALSMDDDQNYCNFLLQSIGYYHLLIEKLLQQQQIHEIAPLLGRIYCNVGDLYRYYELLDSFQNHANHITNKNGWCPSFNEALSYYEKSHVIFPSSGTPLNQIAVIMGYKGELFESIYYCCESLSCKSPCSLAVENAKAKVTKIKNTKNCQNIFDKFCSRYFEFLEDKRRDSSFVINWKEFKEFGETIALAQLFYTRLFLFCVGILSVDEGFFLPSIPYSLIVECLINNSRYGGELLDLFLLLFEILKQFSFGSSGNRKREATEYDIIPHQVEQFKDHQFNNATIQNVVFNEIDKFHSISLLAKQAVTTLTTSLSKHKSCSFVVEDECIKEEILFKGKK